MMTVKTSLMMTSMMSWMNNIFFLRVNSHNSAACVLPESLNLSKIFEFVVITSFLNSKLSSTVTVVNQVCARKKKKFQTSINNMSNYQLQLYVQKCEDYGVKPNKRYLNYLVECERLKYVFYFTK